MAPHYSLPTNWEEGGKRIYANTAWLARSAAYAEYARKGRVTMGRVLERAANFNDY